MREILFRGKRVDNGEWVYGSSFRLNQNLNPFIMLINRGGTSYQVDNNTRSLFTGLTDKNGTKIFEGDIVRYNSNCFVVEYNDKFAAYTLKSPCDTRQAPKFTYITAEYMEVIGNIHDNPELLEENKNA